MKMLVWLNVFAAGLVLVGCETAKMQRVDAVVPHESAVTVRERMRQVRFCVINCGKGDAAKLASSEAMSVVREILIDNGLSAAVSVDDAEIRVDCSCVCTDTTKRGSRMAVRGFLDVAMVRREVVGGIGQNLPSEILATRRFEGKGAEGFTEVEAVRALAVSFRPALAKWLAGAAKTVAADASVVDMCVSDLAPESLKGGFVTRLIKGLSEMPGVYSCRVKSDSQSDTSVTVTVFYDRRQIPDGVSNRMRARGLLRQEGN